VSNDRIAQLAADLYAHVFRLLDAEPGVSGDDAGRVAAAAESAFILACTAYTKE
jgi:hypothetical protein